MKIMDVLSGLDIDQIEIEDQGFFEDSYEVECYYDIKEYNDSRTNYTGRVVFEGNTINPFDHTDETGGLDVDMFANAIRQEIKKAINDPERIGPVYVTA